MKKLNTFKQHSLNESHQSEITEWQERYDQLMNDMEQEAEPEGGPIADRYAVDMEKMDAEKEKIDKKHGKAPKKEMTYGEAMWDSYVGDVSDRRIIDVWDSAVGGNQPNIAQMKADILDIVRRDKIKFEEIERELLKQN